MKTITKKEILHVTFNRKIYPVDLEIMEDSRQAWFVMRYNKKKLSSASLEGLFLQAKLIEKYLKKEAK